MVEFRKSSDGLKKINDDKVRNLLRGVISSGANSEAKAAMQRMRNICSEKDAFSASVFLASNSLAKNVAQSTPFPMCVGDIRKSPFYKETRFGVELSMQSARLHVHSERIVEAISSLRNINVAILEKDYPRFSDLLNKHVERFGLSATTLKKALSAKHTAFIDLESLDISSTVNPFFSPRRNILAVAYEDSIDQELQYIRIRRTFLGYLENGKIPRVLVPILFQVLSPEHPHAPSLSQTLQAHSRWGCLDTLAFLKYAQHRSKFYADEELSDKIRSAIPESINNAWDHAFERIEPQHLANIADRGDSFCEYRIFSNLPAWEEYPVVANYRLAIEFSIGERLDGSFPARRIISDNLCPDVDSIDALIPQTKTPNPSFSFGRISPQKCGSFHRTLALAALIHNRSQISTASGKEILALLDATVDVAYLLSAEELQRLFGRTKTDLLLLYLKSAVIYDADPGRVSRHALRRAIQELVQTEFGGEIVDLAKSLDSSAPHVSEHLYNLCSEYFLTELYDLYSTPGEVVEAHARLLEWYGETREDEEAKVSAKSRRLNLRLRKIRGAIDETRIYVDPLQYFQWAIDNVSSELRGLVGLKAESFIDRVGRSDVSDPVAGVQRPRVQLAQVVDKCYKEFCSNNYFGVDSYIGRRIRHGTLYGVLIAELKPVVDSIVEEFRYSCPTFAIEIDEWFLRLDGAIKKLGTDQLHVRSIDKPSGLINPTIDDRDKYPILHVLTEALISLLDQQRQTAPIVGAIYEYCWLLLEVDLKRARSEIERLRIDFIINPNSSRSTSSHATDQKLMDAIRRLNSDVKSRFEHVSSWLTRPAVVSPSASIKLLFQAVVDEVVGRYPGFQPKISEGGTDIDLLGHRFHFFYDALFVIVDNAAQYGNPSGQLSFHVSNVRLNGGLNEVAMSVTSDFSPETAAIHQERIVAAMKAEIGDAMVREKRSGLRKVRGLVQSVHEIEAFEVSLSGTSATFTLKTHLPVT